MSRWASGAAILILGLFAVGLAWADASMASLAFSPASTREGGVEYRAFHDLRAVTGDLRAVRFDEGGQRVLWRAAQRLEQASPDERIIVTHGRAGWAGLPFEYGRLNASQRAVLDEAEVKWLRGEGNVQRLGPIVRSWPVFVGAPRAVRRNRAPYPLARGEAYARFAADWARRPGVVYVGANDGMLHAFDADRGDELFAYVPNKLIDGDQRFATRLDARAATPDRQFTLVDLTPTVEDAYVRLAPGRARKGWRTLLVGGLGAGGKGYFALDVTDPDTGFSSADEAALRVLWEFTDADDVPPLDEGGQPVTDLDEDGAPVKDLGYATSQARVAMSNLSDAQGGNEWVAVWGNGGGSTAGRAALFVLFIDQGLDGWSAGDFVKLPAGATLGLGEPALVDLDLNGTVDWAYAGDLEGYLHRFDLSDPDPVNWSAAPIFQARYGSGDGLPQSITARPQVLKHPSRPGFMVVFGTGVSASPDERGDAAIQSLYGIWDSGEPIGESAGDLGAVPLARRRMVNIKRSANGSMGRYRVVSDAPVHYPLPGSPESGVRGWRLDLDAPRAGSVDGDVEHSGERPHPRLVAWGDLLLVTTLMPNWADGGAVGAVMPIHWLTGGSPARPVLDLNGDGVLDGADLLPVDDAGQAPGIVFDANDFNGPLMAPWVLAGLGGGGQLILAGGGSRRSEVIGAPLRRLAGRLSWREFSEF